MPARPIQKTETVVERETSLTPLWRVLIHNDDVTPMGLVTEVLQRTFKLTFMAASKVMIEAHFKGIALVVVETREQAEFHIEQAHSIARGQGFPLSFSMEPEG